MIKNYFTIAIRNLMKHKGTSFINIFGLAVGMCCCLLIMLFVKDELSYDRHHADAGNIYRVVKDFVNDDGSRLPDATTPPALAPAMQAEIPGIASVTRVFPGWGNKFAMKYGNKVFLEERLFRVDSSFFEVFTIPFLKGDQRTALDKPTSIVLTQSTAEKYFGNEDPMGKTIHSANLGDLMVTGVVADVPDNSHFHFDFLISIRKFRNNPDLDWGWYNFYTYIKLNDDRDIASIEPLIQALYRKNSENGTNVFYTQPLEKIHLGSNLKWELEANSDKLYVYVFALIALFVILIACINYINLTTARSSLRAKEIGVRKVSGAVKSLLINQFLLESMLTALVSLVLAIGLATILLPVVNQLTQKNLVLFAPSHWGVWISAVGAALLIGLLAGLYPALYLSAFKPVAVLKGWKAQTNRLFNLRKALVVFQFTISIAMIAGTLIVMRQLNFVQRAKLGLDKEQVMIIQGVGALQGSTNYEAFRNELSEMPAVKKLSGADGVVGGQNWANSMRAKGSQSSHLVNFLSVGFDFIDVMGMEIKEGRNFSREFPADTISNGDPGKLERQSGSIILNETAVKQLGVTAPVIGKQIVWAEDEDTTYNLNIIGVVKDFHFTSFKSEIKPFAFVMEPPREGLFLAKLQGDDIQATIAAIEKKWNKYSPDRPFQYSFLDETYQQLYKSETRFKKVFLYITTLAIIIACLGLFGLAAFVTEQRTKEIGIRKVLGASVQGLVTLLSRDFIKLVLIAIILAIPATWYFMNKWLQDFAYRVDLGWWVFLLSGLIGLFIALFTVSFQAVKAAILNPVKSLRAE
jgi:putative ABC transport system permease protein